MNEWKQHLYDWFQEHTIWMHASILLAISYGFMQLSQQLGVTIYLGWITGLIILSFPVCVFLFWRDRYNPTKGKKYWLWWTIAFLIYPFTLFAIPFDINSIGFLAYLSHIDIDGSYAYTTLSFCYLLLEILILYNNRNTTTSWRSKAMDRLDTMSSVAIIFALLALFLPWMNTYFTNHVMQLDTWSTLGYSLFCSGQLFIIYTSYYIYYYIHHHFLFNILLKKKGFIPYLLGVVLILLTLVPIHNFLISLLPLVDDLRLHTTGLTTELFDDINFSPAILTLIFSFPIIVIAEWYKQKSLIDELEKEKSHSELSLLKSQINPHFFFNTLNNLYAMSLTEDKATPESIMQLSELMRYTIYKGKEDQVKLKHEVKYTQDYIDLQMIRTFKEVDYKFSIDVQSDEIVIPPLLFIILVENAFKHGIEPAEKPCKLHLELKSTEHQLIFRCINSIEADDEDRNKEIGLQNLKRRLEILYPDRHKLLLQEDSDLYTATLNITL